MPPRALRCPNCRYALTNLKGLTHSCPECGRFILWDDPALYRTRRSRAGKAMSALAHVAVHLILAGSNMLICTTLAVVGALLVESERPSRVWLMLLIPMMFVAVVLMSIGQLALHAKNFSFRSRHTIIIATLALGVALTAFVLGMHLGRTSY